MVWNPALSAFKLEGLILTCFMMANFCSGQNTSSSFVTHLLEKVKAGDNHTVTAKCDPRSYVQRGYCQGYFSCNRKQRVEEKRGCSDGLFWNPNYNAIHGGVCDYLRNIENETLYEYKKDPACSLHVVYFRATGECSPKYFYNHPVRTSGLEVEETCPTGLIWSKTKESCELCHLVTRSNGTPCCSPAMDDDY